MLSQNYKSRSRDLTFIFLIFAASLVVGLGFSETLSAKQTQGAKKSQESFSIRLFSAAKHLGVKLKQDSNDLSILRISNSTTPSRKLFFQSGLHGNEKGAVHFNKWFMKHVSEKLKNSPEWKNTQIDFIFVANPSGYAANSRYNQNKVNLNRNFSVLFGKTREYPGPNSFSENETKLVKKLAEKESYDAAIDIHGYVNWIVLPTSPTILAQTQKVTPSQVAAYKKLKNAIKKSMPKLKNHKYLTAGFLGDGGSFEDWMFWKANIPSFCLEITRDYTKDPAATREKQYQKYADFIETFIQEVSAGQHLIAANN